MKTLILAMLAAAACGSAANWKDRAEYDLVLDVRAEASPQKRIALLDQWKGRYPASEFEQMRRELYLGAYQSLSDHASMLRMAREMLAAQPDNLVGLYWCVLLTPEVKDAPADLLAVAEKSAQRLMAAQKDRADLQLLSHRALGWVGWQRKQYGAAEEEFKKCLELDPKATEISGWYGAALAAQEAAGKQPEALWHLARAAAYKDTGSLPEANRRQLSSVLERLYVSYHGDADGVDALRLAAASSTTAMPPAGFGIESRAVIALRKEDEELTRRDPQLAAWVRMRRRLDAADGEAYFAESLRGKVLPKLKGTLVRATPEGKPQELGFAVTDGKTEEIVVKLATAFPNAAEVGVATLEFEGVIDSLVKSPFGMVVTAERDQVSGWPAPPVKGRR